MNKNCYEEYERLRQNGNHYIDYQQLFYVDIDRLRVISHIGDMRQNTSLKSRQIQRMENKKRKMSALYMISNLNDKDRKKAMLKSPKAELCEVNQDEPDRTENNRPATESKKRKYDEIDSENVRGNPSLMKQNLSDTDLQKLRVLIRQRFAAKKNVPKLNLKEPGTRASTDQPKEKRIPLFLSDIQHFILYSLHGHMSTGNIPRWANIEKLPRLKNVLFLVIEGMSLIDYSKYEELCPTLKEFPHKLEVITPLAYGGCLIREIATLPLSESQRHKLEKKFGSLGEASTNNRVYKVLRTMFPMDFLKKNNFEPRRNAFSRTELLLSPWQMLEEAYPLPIEGELKAKYADYVYTKDSYKEVTPHSPMWALDCEMCITQLGSELTRISIVNEQLDVVFESFVKPYNPIINYVTKFSGITPQILQNVETRLEDIQTALREIMPPDVILIGHSLNMDLHSLKMLHPYCIDTSVIFNLSGERARKTKLKVLSAEFLGERIQNKPAGHDSVEDAIACMKLVQAKLEHSIEWGDAVICGRQGVEQILANVQRKRYQRINNSPKTKNISRNEEVTIPQNGAILSQPQVIKTRNELPRYICGNQMAQVQMFTTSLFSHLISREKKCLLVARSLVVSECFKYMPEHLHPFEPQSRLQISKQETNKAIVKYGRNNAPENGATLMYTTVERKPELTALKVDRLVKKLTKNLSGNVLVAVLLAGRTTGVDEVDSKNHGLLLLRLHQETVPPIELNVDVYKNTNNTQAVC